MCTQDLSYSVALPGTVDKPESQMGRTEGETQLLLMATALICEGKILILKNRKGSFLFLRLCCQAEKQRRKDVQLSVPTG